jgi:hypothetical protein
MTVAALKARIQGSKIMRIPNVECQNPKEVQNPKLEIV